MDTNTRSWLGVGIAVASLAIGILGSRALGNDDGKPASLTEYGAPVLVQGDMGAATLAGPLLEPVVVSDDPAILDQLLAGSPIESDDLEPEDEGTTGSPSVVGGVMGPTIADTATPGAVEPLDFPLDDRIIFDPAIGELSRLVRLGFDTCAGPLPDSPPPPGCPPGYGATLLDADMPPTAFIWGSEDHYLRALPGDFPVTCPAGTPTARAGQTAYTVFARTPLDSLLVEWRPFGTTIVWQSLIVDPATLTDQRAAWLARLDTELWSLEAFGALPRCILLDRDPNTAYEVRMTGVDAYGRAVGQVGTLVDRTPDLRPPTQARISSGWSADAEVIGWTKPGGSVTFTTKPMSGPEDRDCGFSFDGDPLFSFGQVPRPYGVYDPEFTLGVFTRVPLPAVGMVLLCATIYDTSNTLRPFATDTLVLQAPLTQRPVITLQAIRLDDGTRIDPGVLTVIANTRLGCGQSWTNEEELSGRTVTPAPLLDCPNLQVVDSTGRLEVPVRITRSDDTFNDYGSGGWWIALQLDRCDIDCPTRAAEWHEIPIPSLTEEPCSQEYWETHDFTCPNPYAGVAILRVDYEVTDGPPDGHGSATLVTSSDRPVTDPVAGEPILQMLDPTVERFGDWRQLPATFTIISDRPITINTLSVGESSDDPYCRRVVAIDGPAATEFAIEMPVCALGSRTAVLANVTDAAGVVHDAIWVGWLDLPIPITTRAGVTVEFLGGDVSPVSWIWEFGVAADRQSFGTYTAVCCDDMSFGSFTWSGTRGSGDRCISLYDAVAEGRMQLLNVTDGTLDFSVHLWNSAACDGGADGVLGPVNFTGFFTLDQIQTGEPLVFTTPPFARLAIRVTITAANWHLVDW